ncbi:hypothetical protein TorRG33x02_330450 [Trema orientale]|uniref:Uncharacterized protein n=1 Tax=Trema orientale TaxID=63057 RepID=A0A2P5B726_TREOI|nr:hypothetical protein TorRG33x02_330450 [Trema orientale]
MIGSKRKLSMDGLEDINEGKRCRASHGEKGDENSSVVSVSLENDDIDMSIASYSKGHIDALIEELNRHWCFTGFYGNPKARERNAS